MGRGDVAVQRSACRRLSRFIAVLRAPLRGQHRHLSRAETGNSSVAIAFNRSDRADESATCKGRHCRTVSRSAHRRESCKRHRRQGRGVLAISRRHSGHRYLPEVNRHPRLTARRRAQIIMWDVMFWPIVACILLPWLLVYLGLHVVQRGIIFIDIAMAQMASLGISVAVLIGFEPENWMAYVIGLAVTLVGAAIFSTTGKRASQVPQEAIIGIAYVVSAAAAIL